MRPPPTVMVALVTPFDEEGDILVDDHASNVAHLAAAGMKGFLIGGSTGEGPYLEPTEREHLTTAARAAAPDAFIMCGVAGQSVRQARSQIAEAERAGADAALVLTPVSLVYDDTQAVVGFYRQLAADSPLPLLLYTIRRVTGYLLPVPSVTELASVPGIVGIKDSNGDPERIRDIRAGAGPEFLVYAGASRTLLESMEAGATGAITASANYASDLVRAIVSGRDRAAQEELRSVIAVVESHGLAGTKAAGTLSGLRAGVPRRPLLPAAPGVTASLARVVLSRAR